jgi:O-antigen ligase
MSVSSAHAESRQLPQGRLPVATVSVLVVAAAIAGLLLGGSFGGGSDAPALRPATAPRTIAHDGLRLQVPSGWVRGDAATVPGFKRPLGLRNTGEDLHAAVERLPAGSPTLLPAAFLQTLKSAPERPDLVRLGHGHDAWRYRFPLQYGSQLVLYAVPTTTGIATVACMSPIDAGGCEALASAVTVPRSRALEPGTSAAFYSRLPAAVSDLDAARTKGTRELAAATRATAQAAAADGLARAHKAAGAALAPLTAEGDDLPTTTVGALTASATAHATLASAARARSPRLYADAGRAVTAADADLRRTMTKVNAAASAARTTTQAASTPVRTPAASTSQGIDLWLALLALVGVIAIFLAVRAYLVSSRVMASQVTAPAGVDRGAAIVGFAAAAVAAIAAVAVGPIALAIPLVLVVVLFLLREPLALLALFLSVGLFKEQAFVKSLPVDATLALGVLIATVCAMRVATGRVRPVPFGFALTITIVALSLAVSLAWTPAPAYGGEKATTFLTVTMLAIGAPFFLFDHLDDLRRFFTWIVVVAVPVAILALTHPSEDTGRLAGDNTIGTSRLLCTAALILLLGAVGAVGRSRWRLPPAALAVGFIAIAAAVGSRGPILSLALALALALAAWLLRVPRKVAPVLAVAAVSLAVVPFVSLPAASGQRLSSAARDPVAAFREDDRYFLVQEAFQIIDRHPIRGGGAGAFSTVSTARWPHNLFLELSSELGLVAMVTVAAAILIALVGLYRLAWRLPATGRAQELVYILLAVFFFNLLAVQVSGNINDNRDFWGMLAIAWLVVTGGITAREPAER